MSIQCLTRDSKAGACPLRRLPARCRRTCACGRHRSRSVWRLEDAGCCLLRSPLLSNRHHSLRCNLSDLGRFVDRHQLTPVPGPQGSSARCTIMYCCMVFPQTVLRVARAVLRLAGWSSFRPPPAAARRSMGRWLVFRCARACGLTETRVVG